MKEEMEAINPAFPVDLGEKAWSGMTLRQWYAGQALTGMLATEVGDNHFDPEVIASRCFAFADAMIAEGKKP